MSRGWWIGVLAAAFVGGCSCSDRVDPERAVGLKLGSAPAVARRELGEGQFEFKMEVERDQYFCESRQVGYTGRFLFLYRNGAFVKVCAVPADVGPYRFAWDYLTWRVKQVLDEPAVTKIPRGEPSTLDIQREEADRGYFWYVTIPLTVILLPIEPALITYQAIDDASQKDARDFYGDKGIRLNQKADEVDARRYKAWVSTLKFREGRMVEELRPNGNAPDAAALDVMVENGRVVGVFMVQDGYGVDNQR